MANWYLITTFTSKKQLRSINGTGAHADMKKSFSKVIIQYGKPKNTLGKRSKPIHGLIKKKASLKLIVSYIFELR